MNASTAIRNEFIRASILSFHQGSIGGIPSNKWPDLRSDFVPIDYINYQAKMQTIKVEEGLICDDTSNIEDPELGRTEKIRRMFTDFPLRDPAYLVTIFFVVGSVVFTINSVFGLLPQVAPELAFPTITTVAFPTTLFLGATMFLTAGVVDMLGAFNAENGVVEIAKNESGVQRLEHQPALLGSRGWSWSASGRFTKLIRTEASFQAGLLQFTGGLTLTAAAPATIPGVIDPMAPYFPYLAFVPQVIGGALIFLGNLVSMVAEQDRWWKVSPFNARWQGGFWSGLGGLGFMWSGILLLLAAVVEAAWASLIGSILFLVGAAIIWYDTMGVV